MVPGKANEEWATYSDSLLDENTPDPSRPAAKYLGMILNAYGAGKTEAFNKLVGTYKEQLADSVSARDERRVSYEVFFNHFEPFYACSIVYLFVFLLACVSWISWREPLRQSAFWLAVVALLVHTWALLSRMYLLDRPLVFVTNLYSSAVFIGWGCGGAVPGPGAILPATALASCSRPSSAR